MTHAKLWGHKKSPECGFPTKPLSGMDVSLGGVETRLYSQVASNIEGPPCHPFIPIQSEGSTFAHIIVLVPPGIWPRSQDGYSHHLYVHKGEEMQVKRQGDVSGSHLQCGIQCALESSV